MMDTESGSDRYDAWVWNGPGDPDRLHRVEKQVGPVGAGDIIVANTMAAFNPVDWKIIREGHPAWQAGHVPGVDGVGRIVTVGAGVTLPVGLRVAYHQGLGRDGSFAQRIVLKAASALPVPDGLSDEQAVSVPCPGLTAWQSIGKVPALPDRDVLVTGAGGSVSLILAQLAVKRGWRVWVTAGPAHHAHLLELGVSGAFDYRDDAWRTKLAAALGPRRLFAAFDTTSGTYARTLADLIGYNGHLVCIQDRLETAPLPAFTTAVSLHEVALNSIHEYGTAADWRDWRSAGTTLLEAVRIGALDLQPATVTSFDDLPRNLSSFMQGNLKGKILVNISGDQS